MIIARVRFNFIGTHAFFGVPCDNLPDTREVLAYGQAVQSCQNPLATPTCNILTDPPPLLCSDFGKPPSGSNAANTDTWASTEAIYDVAASELQTIAGSGDTYDFRWVVLFHCNLNNFIITAPN